MCPLIRRRPFYTQKGMRIMKKRILSLLLALVLGLGLLPGVVHAGDDGAQVRQAISAVQSWLAGKASEGSYVYGDEWIVFSLTRSGAAITDAQRERYLASVKETYREPKKAALKPTTLARVALTLTSLGEDASDLDGIDLISLLCTSKDMTAGSNEAIWAITALDSGAYAVPGGAQWTREALTEQILSYQNPENGGFGLYDNKQTSVDLTAMSITAVAAYYGQSETVKAAVDRGLAYLTSTLDAACDYGSSESAAQVVVALAALGLDPTDPANGFVKGGNQNIVTDLLSYQNPKTGAFLHVKSQGDNMLASVQGLYALEACRRFLDGENRLYDMTDVFAQSPGLPFEDVKEGSWYYDAVKYVYENGMMNGMSDTVFAPKGTVNRAMVAQILYNIGGRPEVTGASPFADVAEAAWYKPAITWAASMGYVNGMGDGRFDPKGDITREQLAAILYRYSGSPQANGSPEVFADWGSIHSYAVDAMSWAVERGILKGYADGTLAPRKGANRAELATVLRNLFAQ